MASYNAKAGAPVRNAFPAPGSSGPSPLPAEGALVQAGRMKVVSTPGDPNFPADIVKRQTHPKSRPVPNHPAHRNRADRGSRSDGNVILEAGAAAAAGLDSAS